MTAEIIADLDFLRRFEAGLNPLHPERSAIPARILGYGEISAVIACDAGNPALAYKRMPLFDSEAEAEEYVALYEDYTAVLAQAGLSPIPGKMVWLPKVAGRGTVIYLLQPKLAAEAIAPAALQRLAPAEVRALFTAVLDEFAKVFTFNEQNRAELEIGFDGQLSNWAVAGIDPMRLVYFDTGTPLLRRNGREQINAEIFLRSAPSFLAWLLKRLFLADVVGRYYDGRKVCIDLLANLIKEQRSDLIPEVAALCNERWAGEQAGFPPISSAEVQAYYREDAFIWRLYLGARRLDRSLHRLAGKGYPHLLPGAIKR
jgi:hypothetical protein